MAAVLTTHEAQANKISAYCEGDTIYSKWDVDVDSYINHRSIALKMIQRMGFGGTWEGSQLKPGQWVWVRFHREVSPDIDMTKAGV